LSGKRLDCVGIYPDRSQVGKHDFQPNPQQPIIHGPGNPLGAVAKPRSPEPIDRYCSEKITELAMMQQELARVRRERNALANGYVAIESGDMPDGKPASPNARQFAAEMLAKLEAGELRKA
jgi:hypothetical protein